MDKLKIADIEFSSRLFLGTGKFASNEVMRSALEASEASMVTVALRRVDLSRSEQDVLHFIDRSRFKLLPNTSGARTAKEAIFLAHLARESGLASSTSRSESCAAGSGLGTWLKLEVIPDPQYLMPDPIETLAAAETLVKEGFTVLPYIHADPVLAKRLADVGCAAVMPLAAPIGSNRGLKMRETIRIIIEQAAVPVVVDAGLGVPSHACEAMEMGADAVLVNTAIATAEDPVVMAEAFRLAVVAGRKAYLAGRGRELLSAEASSPLQGVTRG